MQGYSEAWLDVETQAGHQLEVILGHAIYCALLNRSVMPIFHATYKFIPKHYEERVLMWDSVRHEFEAFSGLLPLCFSDWRRPWNGHVSASHASLSGYGVCSRSLDPEIAAEIGRVPEPERFRRGAVGGARASALASVLAEEEASHDDSSPMGLLEAGWEVNSKFVEVLVDYLPVALSFDRGRSRNYKLFRCIRKFSAICLSRNITCSVRWVPSEYSSAGKPF